MIWVIFDEAHGRLIRGHQDQRVKYTRDLRRALEFDSAGSAYAWASHFPDLLDCRVMKHDSPRLKLREEAA